jgi:tripartite-type tricarboxylate transporter receptor subunit TctC
MSPYARIALIARMAPIARIARMAAAFTLATLFAAPCLAQKPQGLPGNYPSKPVRILISAAPGGGADYSGRTVFAKLGERWGTTFIPDNSMAGAGGLISMEAGAKAPPDGYTLLITSGSTYIAATFTGKFPFDTRKAYTPIAQFTTGAVMVAAYPPEPYNDLKGMIAYAKANPGKMSYGATGVGSSLHLTGELIQYMAGIKMQHIPYKGTGQSVIDAISGRLNIVIGSTTALVPHVRAGKVKTIGITSAQRLPSIPDQPTLAEMGLPEMDYTSWFGVVGPAGMNPAIVNALNSEINRILATPELVKMFLDQGTDLMTGSTEQFRGTILGTLDKTEKVLKATGLKLEQ